jgi:hypothetical protein
MDLVFGDEGKVAGAGFGVAGEGFGVAGAAFGGGDFFKLSAAVGLDRWAEAPESMAGLFGILVRVLREA